MSLSYLLYFYLRATHHVQMPLAVIFVFTLLRRFSVIEASGVKVHVTGRLVLNVVWILRVKQRRLQLLPYSRL